MRSRTATTTIEPKMPTKGEPLRSRFRDRRSILLLLLLGPTGNENKPSGSLPRMLVQRPHDVGLARVELNLPMAMSSFLGREAPLNLCSMDFLRQPASLPTRGSRSIVVMGLYAAFQRSRTAIPIDCGQAFQLIADSIPTMAES